MAGSCRTNEKQNVSHCACGLMNSGSFDGTCGVEGVGSGCKGVGGSRQFTNLPLDGYRGRVYWQWWRWGVGGKDGNEGRAIRESKEGEYNPGSGKCLLKM